MHEPNSTSGTAGKMVQRQVSSSNRNPNEHKVQGRYVRTQPNTMHSSCEISSPIRTRTTAGIARSHNVTVTHKPGWRNRPNVNRSNKYNTARKHTTSSRNLGREMKHRHANFVHKLKANRALWRSRKCTNPYGISCENQFSKKQEHKTDTTRNVQTSI